MVRPRLVTVDAFRPRSKVATSMVVAIPSLMLYRYFRGRIDEYTIDLEQASERIMPHLLRFTSRQS